jgi:flagellar L-ring protein precursor FlgH
MLNNGNEYVRVTGLVRPEDISSDNTVSSQRIANARIQYGGTGDFASTQERGWLSKFFNSVFNIFF